MLPSNVSYLFSCFSHQLDKLFPGLLALLGEDGLDSLLRAKVLGDLLGRSGAGVDGSIDL